MSTLLLCKEMHAIFFGSSCGSIRMYLWPFDFSLKTQDVLEIPVAQGSISRLVITSDQKVLISGSEDGSIYFVQIREFIDGHEVNQQFVQINTQEIQAKVIPDSIYSLNQLTMTCKLDQETLKDQIKELEFRIQNIYHDNEDEKEDAQ